MRFALALVLCAAPAFAAVPEKGEGTIAILGGVRSILPSSQDYLNEQQACHSALEPGGFASFGYQYDDELQFRIEMGYLVGRFRTGGGADLHIRSIPILRSLDTV